MRGVDMIACIYCNGSGRVEREVNRVSPCGEWREDVPVMVDCEECYNGTMPCIHCDAPAEAMLGIDPVCSACRGMLACEVCGEDHDTGEHRDWAYDRMVAAMERRMGV
jgi:hypothetical protein